MLRDEIKDYTDGNGLVSNGLVTPGTVRASDNGTMFTAEYYIMLAYSNELASSDRANFNALIQKCVGADRELHRSPGDTSPDEVDDHYGVLAAYTVLNMPNTLPFKLPIRLYRQPQLLLAYLVAKHGYIPFYARFLSVIAAIVIATSCRGAPTSDTDARRLSWLLIQTLESKSALCWLASKAWYNRLYKDYGIDGMLGVAKIYYEGNHPFKKYWVTEKL